MIMRGVCVIKRLFKYFVFIFILVIIILLIWSQFNSGSSLGNGYRLIDVRLDNVYILNNDKTIVVPTIVDHYENSSFIAGLRLPVRFLTCENGSSSEIRILNIKKFFLLNKESGRLTNFSDHKVFEEALSKFINLDSVSLDYSKFDVIWDKYSKLYARSSVSDCEPYPLGTKEHENSEK